MRQAPDGFGFDAEFLSPVEESKLLRDLRDLTYTCDETFRDRIMKRVGPQFGDTYDATGRRMDGTFPVPAVLKEVRETVTRYYPTETTVTQRSVTHCTVTFSAAGYSVAGIAIFLHGSFSYREEKESFVPARNSQTEKEVSQTPQRLLSRAKGMGFSPLLSEVLFQEER